MKTMAAKDAKNRFGQLIDAAQREPVTIEKNGRPFVVVQSYEDFYILEKLKLSSLRSAIEAAREEYVQGRGTPFDRAAVKDILTEGRQRLVERDDDQ